MSRQVIKEDTILTVDAEKGKVKSSFGSGIFYMPHGLKIDKDENIWVTDVGLHQVLKFNRGQTKPSLGTWIYKILEYNCHLYLQCLVRSSHQEMMPIISVNQPPWQWLLVG